MRQKWSILAVALAALLCFASCGKDADAAAASASASAASASAASAAEAAEPEIVPSTRRMMDICELATVECYYHDVAKVLPPEEKSILPWVQYQHYWMEYAGKVVYGIDVSQVEITVDGSNVDITLPEAEVLDCDLIENDTESDSVIVAKDSLKITAADEAKTLTQAKAALLEKAENATKQLERAQQKAETLLEDYVTNLGEATGKTYTVTFHTLGQESAAAAQANT